MTRVFVLIATIPPRRASCERLLGELARQSRVPDGVILCPDGYDGADMEALAVRGVYAFGGAAIVYPSAVCGGPGHKWRVAADCNPDDILIVIDDDTVLDEAPHLIGALCRAVEEGGGAAAAMGRLSDGRRAPPGDVAMGRLLYGCGCGLAVRARHLASLHELAEEVKAAGGPDALGPCGDDDALVSAHLWRRGIPILHAATGNLYSAPGTERHSQTRARLARGEDLQDQKRAIARITGWPWVEAVVETIEEPALTWERQVDGVPPGAVRARGPARSGYVRVLAIDAEEPDRSGVYDVPTE